MHKDSSNIRTVYLKVTNRCNIGCDFCYLPEDVRGDKTVMSPEISGQVARSLSVANNVEGFDRVHLVVHGGEPLILSGSALSGIVSSFSEGLDQKMMVSIQTSLIPLGSRHFEFISDWCDGFIGSSLDMGQRKIAGSSAEYAELWLRKYEMARNNGFEVRPIIVPAKSEIPKVADFVSQISSWGITGFDIDRYTDYGSAANPEMPTNREHAQYLIDLTEVLIKKYQSGVKVGNNVVEAAMRGVMMSVPGERWGGSCQKQFLVVEPDGSFNTCPDRASREDPFGTALNPDSILHSEQRLKWVDHQAHGHKTADCYRCEYSAWCGSGCPIVENVDSSQECSGYKSYLDYVSGLDRSLMQQFLNTKEGEFCRA